MHRVGYTVGLDRETRRGPGWLWCCGYGVWYFLWWLEYHTSLCRKRRVFGDITAVGYGLRVYRRSLYNTSLFVGVGIPWALLVPSIFLRGYSWIPPAVLQWTEQDFVCRVCSMSIYVVDGDLMCKVVLRSCQIAGFLYMYIQPR